MPSLFAGRCVTNRYATLYDNCIADGEAIRPSSLFYDELVRKDVRGLE